MKARAEIERRIKVCLLWSISFVRPPLLYCSRKFRSNRIFLAKNSLLLRIRISRTSTNYVHVVRIAKYEKKVVVLYACSDVTLRNLCTVYMNCVLVWPLCDLSFDYVIETATWNNARPTSALTHQYSRRPFISRNVCMCECVCVRALDHFFISASCPLCSFPFYPRLSQERLAITLMEKYHFLFVTLTELFGFNCLCIFRSSSLSASNFAGFFTLYSVCRAVWLGHTFFAWHGQRVLDTWLAGLYVRWIAARIVGWHRSCAGNVVTHFGVVHVMIVMASWSLAHYSLCILLHSILLLLQNGNRTLICRCICCCWLVYAMHKIRKIILFGRVLGIHVKWIHVMCKMIWFTMNLNARACIGNADLIAFTEIVCVIWSHYTCLICTYAQ